MREGEIRTSVLLAAIFLSVIASPFFSNSEYEIGANESTVSFTDDAWDIANFSDVAVPAGFNQSSYIDYSDVGVLINNKSEASRTIGWSFVNSRNIPLEHVLLWDKDGTPTGETINRNQFNDFFAQPFREWIFNNSLDSELNFLVTTKGVPLKINGGNNKASFDNEIGLVGGTYDSYIGQDYWTDADYGPLADNGNGKMEAFSREKHGFFLVTRLTGYTVDSALELIEKSNNSLGNRGQFVLDLATNRNDSGYKFWNDDLYIANTTLNDTMGLPVLFNQNSTFVTNQSGVMGYASWGSNDGSWNTNLLPNSGFDTSDSAWETNSRYWNSTDPALASGEGFSWERQTAVKRNGNAAIEGQLTQSQSVCTSGLAIGTNGVFAEYFDNNGVTFNNSLMPDLSGRTADYTRIESTIDHPTSTNVWNGLDSSRFSDHFSARYTAFLEIPEDGNWTFYLGADDGGIFDLDGARFIDNQGIHPYQEVSNSTNLTAGFYPINVEVFEQGGWAGIGLSWEGPNVSKQIIPNSFLNLATHSSGVSDNQLVNYWSFNHSSGTQIYDSISNENMTLIGGGAGTNWTTGIDNSSYNFNGNDEYAKADVNNWEGNFSVSLWVYTDDANQALHSSVFAVNDVAGDGSSFQIETDGNGDWQIWHNSTYTIGTVDAGEWTHLAVTFSENNVLKLYKNGILVRTENVNNGTIDSIELYKIGVNRAGNTFFSGKIDEVKIWNRTLGESEVLSIKEEIVWQCPQYSGIGSSQASIEQEFVIEEELRGHVWNVWAYGQKQGWISANWGIEVESFSENGTLLSSNVSSTQHLTETWEQDYMRFEPHENATKMTVRLFADFDHITHNGSIFFDTFTLRVIKPHMEWINGSIVETAVSTGGRSFNPGTTYGQSLIADILEDGASAAKGYVYEPYLTAVCYPSILMSTYAQGYTMAEAYYASNPMISWMGVIVGDPKMAAYSDRLHDVNISSMQTNKTLTVGVNGTIRLVIENLGMGEANGTIEIRERSGNKLLSAYHLSLPSGDQSGSRIILDANVAPSKSGYVEFIARWRNSSFEFPERVTENNEKSLNILINEIPLVEDAWCSSLEIERGSSFTCIASATDEIDVNSVNIGWRLRNYTQNTTTEWVWSGAVEFANGDWWSSIQIPRNISLGSIDIAVEAFDNLNASSGVYTYSNLSTVINAIPNWNGIHVQSVDDEQWYGDSDLTSTPENGVIRGEQLRLRGCVEDADHDVLTEQPNFAASRGVVGSVSFHAEIESGLYCYNSTWIIPIGGDIEPVTIELWENGILYNERTIKISDRNPVVELELKDSNGFSVENSRGANEQLWIDYYDPDDPGTGAYGDLRITWPEMLPITIPIYITDNSTGVLVDLPSAPEGLTRGNVLFEVDLVGAHSNNVVFSKQWDVSVTVPRILNIGVCDVDGEVQEIEPGKVLATYLHVQSTRPIENVRISLTQSDWYNDATPLDVTVEPWNTSTTSNCGANSSIMENRTNLLTYSMIADGKFIGGGAEIVVQIVDIDGLSSSFFFPITIAHTAPELSLIGEIEYTEGENIELSLIVSDPDGFTGTVCNIMFSNETDSQLISIDEAPDSSGEIRFVQVSNNFPLQENITVNATCIDSKGLVGVAELSEKILISKLPPSEQNIETDTSEMEEINNSNPILVIVALLIIIGTVPIVRNLVSKRKVAQLEKEDVDQEKAWGEIAMLEDVSVSTQDKGEDLQPISTIATNEKQQSAVEIQHADQPEKSDDNTEAEESFERDIAASEEAVKSQSFDDIIEDLSD